MGWGAPGLGDDLGGVAKPPMMPRGVGVGPHPWDWDCLRGILLEEEHGVDTWWRRQIGRELSPGGTETGGRGGKSRRQGWSWRRQKEVFHKKD